MADRLFVGLDSGTQGTKGIVLSEKRKRVVAEASCTYELVENLRGGREQDPAVWLEACRSVLGELVSSAAVNSADICAIGVSGQQHGMVALDRDGNVIRPAKLWCDTETVDQCNTLSKRLGGETGAVSAVGNQFSAGFTASKVLWLKEHEPQHYNRLATLLLPHDYINFWLTGTYTTECGDASGTAYFDVVNRRWSKAVLQALDRDRDLSACLPDLIGSDQACGTILSSVADELQLPRSVVVSSGGGDNMMAAIGTGNVVPGIVTMSLGTSGTIYSFSDVPVVDPSGEMAAFCSSTGGWLPLVCTMNVTVATELVRSLLGMDLDRLNRAIGETAAGSEGLVLVPYFNGERTPPLPTASATLAGMSGSNLRPGTLARAAMEGATMGLRYGFDVMRRNGIETKQIRLVGGGSKSAVWRQMVADVFGCEVIGLDVGEAGALGAALQALWCVESAAVSGVGIEAVTDVYVRPDISSRCVPDKERVTLYRQLYERYLELDACLTKTYPSISPLTGR